MPSEVRLVHNGETLWKCYDDDDIDSPLIYTASTSPDDTNTECQFRIRQQPEFVALRSLQENTNATQYSLADSALKLIIENGRVTEGEPLGPAVPVDERGRRIEEQEVVP